MPTAAEKVSCVDLVTRLVDQGVGGRSALVDGDRTVSTAGDDHVGGRFNHRDDVVSTKQLSPPLKPSELVVHNRLSRFS
jgi:hypothetical protein